MDDAILQSVIEQSLADVPESCALDDDGRLYCMCAGLKCPVFNHEVIPIRVYTGIPLVVLLMR